MYPTESEQLDRLDAASFPEQPDQPSLVLDPRGADYARSNAGKNPASQQWTGRSSFLGTPKPTARDRMAMTNDEVAALNPGGRVTVAGRNAQGKANSFSGMNVAGPVSYVDRQGDAIEGAGANGQGFGPTVVVGAPGAQPVMGPNGSYAVATGGPSTDALVRAGQLGGRVDQYGNVIDPWVDRALTGPNGRRMTPQDVAVMGANVRDGVNPYQGTAGAPVERGNPDAAARMAQMQRLNSLLDLRSPEGILLANARRDLSPSVNDNPAARAAAQQLIGRVTESAIGGASNDAARVYARDDAAVNRERDDARYADGRGDKARDFTENQRRYEQNRQDGEPQRELGGLRARIAQRIADPNTPEDERERLIRATGAMAGKAGGVQAPPSGYRWAPSGELQPIPGGPADRPRDPKLTEDQGKSAGYAVRMENSLNLLNGINQTNPGATRPGVGTALLNTLPEGVANMVRPEDRQRVEAAQLDALDAALTLNTGAAYTREQLQGMSRSYFAQPGDSDLTVREKQNRLASLIETARLRAGPQGNQMADEALRRSQQPAQPAAPQMPQTGEIRRGYRFRGGDPANRGNWEAVQ